MLAFDWGDSWCQRHRWRWSSIQCWGRCRWYGIVYRHQGNSPDKDHYQRVDEHPGQAKPQRFLLWRRRGRGYVLQIVWGWILHECWIKHIFTLHEEKRVA